MIDFARLPRGGGISSSLALVSPWPWRLGFACIGTVLAGLLSLLPYVAAWLLLTQALDAATPWKVTVWSALVLLLGWMLRHLLGYWSKVTAHHLAFSAIAQLKQALLAKLERVALTHFDRIPLGEHNQLIGEQADELEDAVAHLLPELSAATLVPLTLALLLLWVDWRMGLASLLPYVLAILASVASMSRGREAGQQAMRAWNELTQRLGMLVRHQMLLRTYNQADTAFKRVDTALTDFERRSVSAVRQPLALAVVFMVLGNGSLSAVLLLGGVLHWQGSLSLSLLAFFCIVSIGLGNVYSDVFGFFLRLGKLKAIWKRVFGLLDAEELAWGHVATVPRSAADLALRHVSVSREGRRILSDVTLSVPAGSSLALVGPSGAGKTTLARVLLRYGDPQEGEVMLAGRPLAAYSQAALRGAMAFVSQHTELFALSVTDNIRLGRPNADVAEVQAVARLTLCHDFVEALPEGYATVLAPGGGNLSGGQRQRLALARALLVDAPVLVLDEALAFSDIESEAQIQRAIEALARGRTLVVIAHRLPTIRSLDCIAVLDCGRVIEQGSHSELIAAGGHYACQWRHLERPWTEMEATP